MEIWKGNPRKKDELWLFPGVHEYPFTYNLPIDLPESMDDSGYANINYTIKVCNQIYVIQCVSFIKVIICLVRGCVISKYMYYFYYRLLL